MPTISSLFPPIFAAMPAKKGAAGGSPPGSPSKKAKTTDCFSEEALAEAFASPLFSAAVTSALQEQLNTTLQKVLPGAMGPMLQKHAQEMRTEQEERDKANAARLEAQLAELKAALLPDRKAAAEHAASLDATLSAVTARLENLEGGSTSVSPAPDNNLVALASRLEKLEALGGGNSSGSAPADIKSIVEQVVADKLPAQAGAAAVPLEAAVAAAVEKKWAELPVPSPPGSVVDGGSTPRASAWNRPLCFTSPTGNGFGATPPSAVPSFGSPGPAASFAAGGSAFGSAGAMWPAVNTQQYIRPVPGKAVSYPYE